MIFLERDYKKEYQKSKNSRSILSTTVSKETAEDFRAKCSLDGVSVNAFLKSCVDAYLNNSLTYEDGKLKMN